MPAFLHDQQVRPALHKKWVCPISCASKSAPWAIRLENVATLRLCERIIHGSRRVGNCEGETEWISDNSGGGPTIGRDCRKNNQTNTTVALCLKCVVFDQCERIGSFRLVVKKHRLEEDEKKYEANEFNFLITRITPVCSHCSCKSA